MNQRIKDLWDDARKYFRQALTEWKDSIEADPIQHIFTLAAGLTLGASILWVL